MSKILKRERFAVGKERYGEFALLKVRRETHRCVHVGNAALFCPFLCAVVKFGPTPHQ